MQVNVVVAFYVSWLLTFIVRFRPRCLFISFSCKILQELYLPNFLTQWQLICLVNWWEPCLVSCQKNAKLCDDITWHQDIKVNFYRLTYLYFKLTQWVIINERETHADFTAFISSLTVWGEHKNYSAHQRFCIFK